MIPWISSIPLLVVPFNGDEGFYWAFYMSGASISIVRPFYPLGLNRFIWPGLTFAGEPFFAPLGLTTLTVDSTYSSRARALLISGSNRASVTLLETATLLRGDNLPSYCDCETHCNPVAAFSGLDDLTVLDLSFFLFDLARPDLIVSSSTYTEAALSGLYLL